MLTLVSAGPGGELTFDRNTHSSDFPADMIISSDTRRATNQRTRVFLEEISSNSHLLLELGDKPGEASHCRILSRAAR
jgi:hypothetical protein